MIWENGINKEDGAGHDDRQWIGLTTGKEGKDDAYLPWEKM